MRCIFPACSLDLSPVYMGVSSWRYVSPSMKVHCRVNWPISACSFFSWFVVSYFNEGSGEAVCGSIAMNLLFVVAERAVNHRYAYEASIRVFAQS